MRFRQWIEAVVITGYSKTGEISFNQDGVRYRFLADAAMFYNGWFARLLQQRRHQEAFDAMMQEVQAGRAQQLEPAPQPQQPQQPDPPTDPPSDDQGTWTQQELF